MIAQGRRLWGTASAVFLREAVRNARRWQTYALRVAFGASLFGMVILMSVQMMQSDMDVARAGRLGSDLFIGYCYVQLFLVATLAPVLASLGLSEERDQDTLDLLRMTGLGARQIVLGKVTARLLVLATFVVSSTPVLAMVLGFGGVAPGTVLNTVLATLFVLVVLGLLGGVLGLFFRGTVGPVVIAGAWAVTAFLVAPGLYAGFLGGNQRAMADLSPLYTPLVDDPGGLLPLLAFLPVVLLLVSWAGPLFTLSSGVREEDDEPVYDRDFWRFESHRAVAGAMGLMVVLALPMILLVAPAFHRQSLVLPYDLARIVLWLWFSATIATGTALLLLAVLQGQAWVASLSRGRRRQIEARAALARGRGGNLERRVWQNPVLWRELMTRAFGLPGVVARYSFPGWVVLMSAFGMMNGMEGGVLFGLTGVLIAVSYGLTFGTDTFASEQQARTLELLVLSTLPPWRIVAGKLVAALSYGAPFLLLGWAVHSAYQFTTDLDFPRCGGPGVGHTPILRMALPLAWVTLLWITATLWSMASTLLLRTARSAWVANAVLVGCWVTVPTVVSTLFRGQVSESVFAIAMPFLQPGWMYPGCGVAWQEVAGVALLVATSLGLFALMTLRLRRWSRE